MSERNGDKARFQKNRKRSLRQRERTRAFVASVRATTNKDASGGASERATPTSKEDVSRAASLAMQDEGGPTRSGD